MHPVGELDEQHANIVGGCKEELAKVFRLCGVFGGKLEAREFGHAIDEICNLGAKKLFDFLVGCFGVFERIVEERGNDGGKVAVQAGKDVGDRNRMRKIRFAGKPFLVLVHAFAVVVRPLDELAVGKGVVCVNLLEEFSLPDHVGVLMANWLEIRAGGQMAREMTRLAGYGTEPFRPRWNACL